MQHFQPIQHWEPEKPEDDGQLELPGFALDKSDDLLVSLGELEDVGLTPQQLEHAFTVLGEYTDVDFPAPPVPRPDPSEIRALRRGLDGIQSVAACSDDIGQYIPQHSVGMDASVAAVLFYRVNHRLGVAGEVLLVKARRQVGGRGVLAAADAPEPSRQSPRGRFYSRKNRGKYLFKSAMHERVFREGEYREVLQREKLRHDAERVDSLHQHDAGLPKRVLGFDHR